MIRSHSLHSTRRLAMAAAALVAAALVTAWPRPAAAEPPPITFTWGGYIKLDGIYSSNTRGRPSDVADYLLAPGLIPAPTAGDNQALNFTARESRLWFHTSLATERGALDSHVEIDFLGFDTNLGSELTTTSSSPRLRHAYATWNGWLVGQTWTTWMDFDALPETNDFGSQAGRVFARQAQVRYTRPLGSSGGQVQLAVENPETSLTDPTGVQVVPTDDLMPDIVAKVHFAGPWGHVAAAGIGRMLRSEDALPAADDVTDMQFGAGGRISGKLMLGEKHNLRFDATAGRGIGRYVGLNAVRDGEIDAEGNIRPIDLVATLVSGQAWLNDTVRVNLVGSMEQALNNDEALAALVSERLITVHGNVMWSPIPSVRLGVEYIHARRRLESGVEGVLHRVQASARYMF
jgi:hypothetical protein